MSAATDAASGQPSDAFEEQLVRSLAHTGHGFETDPAPLIAAGLSRGRRTRWRRRAALGAATALVLVGAATAVTLDLPHRAAAPPAAPAPSASATADGGPRSRAFLADQLTRLLPGGRLTVSAGGSTGAGAFLNGSYWSGGTTVSFVLEVLRTDPARRGPLPSCTGEQGCEQRNLPDGSQALLVKGVPGQSKQWAARLDGPEGRQVVFREIFDPGRGRGPVEPESPLTADQLAGVVDDPAWGEVALAVPAAEAYRQPVRIAGETVMDTAVGLLPAGLAHHPIQASEGFATFTVDDGHGGGLVEVTVEDWVNLATEEQLEEPKEVAGWDRLPDGTRLHTAEGLDDSALAGLSLRVRTAEVFRPDSLYVRVRTLNSPGHAQPATRTDPVLTVDQLKAIVLSPEWHRPAG